jgi:hypothetical protein
MGASASKRIYISNNRKDAICVRNGVPPIKQGNGIDADGRSIYSDKPSRRTYNIPVRTNIENCK